MNTMAELMHGTLTDILEHLEGQDVQLHELQAAVANIARQLRQIQAELRANELREAQR